MPPRHVQRRALNTISDNPANPCMRAVNAALADIIAPSVNGDVMETFAGAPPVIETDPGGLEMRLE